MLVGASTECVKEIDLGETDLVTMDVQTVWSLHFNSTVLQFMHVY